MKNKNYSRSVKLLLVIGGVIASVLKWFDIMGNASITEIWQVVAFAYGVGLGTMDLNIVVDNWKGK